MNIVYRKEEKRRSLLSGAASDRRTVSNLIKNINRIITEYKVPVYFFIGNYDYNTPFQISEEFFNQIKAPKKEYIWFEHSAHMPNFEEPQKMDEFNRI